MRLIPRIYFLPKQAPCMLQISLRQVCKLIGLKGLEILQWRWNRERTPMLPNVASARAVKQTVKGIGPRQRRGELRVREAGDCVEYKNLI